MAAQVAVSSSPVTGTPWLACQARSADSVCGPKIPSAVAPMTFWAKATSEPVDPTTRIE